MQTLSPQVETIHQAVHRAFPGSRTVSVNEPCDIGADYSTFAQFTDPDGNTSLLQQVGG